MHKNVIISRKYKIKTWENHEFDKNYYMMYNNNGDSYGEKNI